MYSASFIISLGLCISFSISYRHKGRHYLPLSYAFAAYLYAFSILVSISSPVNESHAATSFICLQIIFPLLIFDRSLRVDALVTLAYLIHTVLSYHYKSFSNFTLDLFNGAAFTIVGIIIGEYERFIRLVNFEKDRILVYQKNTDMLTNLQNRRSLFEYLATSAQRKNAKEASIGGFFMIDIDHFKIFNDTYGHQAGDSCLLQLGAAFLSWGAEHGFTFYRYGGEEFIAVGNQSDYSWLGEQAESLRK
ncbi:MAG: GGDEF domain-containing protein, partial [Treponema sp.]|nr:GGDEF domain-containing protein [Treponema sp.]